jgi:hypothetical protein
VITAGKEASAKIAGAEAFVSTAGEGLRAKNVNLINKEEAKPENQKNHIETLKSRSEKIKKSSLIKKQKGY